MFHEHHLNELSLFAANGLTPLRPRGATTSAYRVAHGCAGGTDKIPFLDNRMLVSPCLRRVRANSAPSGFVIGLGDVIGELRRQT